MKWGRANFRFPWLTFSAIATLMIGGHVAAAPGTLADKPLILETTPVQPNIFFMVDDSGSMDWEDILNVGTEFPAESAKGHLDFSPDNALEKRLLCRGFNVMAYDPNVTYKPWAGVDSNGDAYADLTLTTARDNPYSTTTTDISSHVYVSWKDSDSDGEYDGPGSTDISSSSSTGDECDIDNPIDVSGLSTAEQTNYANWYSYYRKREYVAKRALSQIIKDSSARVGLGSLHNHNNIRTQVKDIDDISLPVNATAQSNKTDLLDNLFNISSSNGTPLRAGLKNVGEYFAGNLSGTWGDSPILPEAQGGQCQKNFTILMSDGFWNGGSPGVGNTDKGNGPWDGDSYEDNVSNTLADVAMKYYETDLSSLDDKVGIIPGIDENTAQHLVTYTVAFGVNGTLDANPPNSVDAFDWPTPSADDPTTIDDMRHAAWNGRGKFLSAGDPQQLINSLNNAIKDIDSRSGSSAAAALNTTSLQSDSMIFMASYDSVAWRGSLSALEIKATGEVVKPPKWEAGTKLNNIDQDTLLATRKIYTYNGSAIKAFNSTNATTLQKADLLVGKPDSETDDSYLSRMIKFIYGDHTDETGESGKQYFRNRGNQRLGDIVHSAPVYVGVPNTPYPDAIEGTDNLYSDFISDQSDRTGTVFVGSNDGMLHAFKATDGSEEFAYIPNLIFSSGAGKGLHALADPLYDHNYYVDLTPAVADVYVDSKWKTLLIGGLRGGGKGIFALDITTEGSPKVQFEFTDTNMGYTFSEIQVGKMNNGKWAAVFGNGYNNTGDGKAKLYIVYLDGSGDKIIDTAAGSISNSDCSDASSDCNGLSTPTLADLNGDGMVDRIYAGDVQGNMWTFDVSSDTVSNWDLAYDDGNPLFIACRSTESPCPAADRQPITSKPALARHPTQRSAATFANIIVMFGTGQFIASGDVDDTAVQSVYGVWDRNDSGQVRGDLIEQTVTETTAAGVPIRVTTDNNVAYASGDTTDYGWFYDLPSNKERVVVNPVAYGDILFVNTMIPESAQLCDSAGGEGWLMAVDIFNGGTPDFAPLDINADGTFDADDGITDLFAVGSHVDGIPTESKFVSDKRITVDSNKNVNVNSVQGVPPGQPARMSWTSL